MRVEEVAQELGVSIPYAYKGTSDLIKATIPLPDMV